ncbi:flavin reductase family protein [Ectothiorhodospira sp. BSL-9]|uniref:flavin reductase family protein n=1 Tax=Ectothiorhodospira sp. BSL-9 TaxID=1442136 RepID=UPI0007B42D78|nr:flavin reductase family protein [Ectothiorhodospira sp. BSL-9]ANB01047.1 nitrilotriacetate monooxygenase [Ectothiorhodospira sp. BSL-9]TVQ72647.1 MAG: flavin reductase [Chromatiaceae bacterium]
MNNAQSEIIDSLPVIDPRRFRDALGRFATGITVITCLDPQGEVPNGFTANSFSSLSLDPPLVLFSLRRDAGCLAAFERARAFAVNVLAEDHQDLSNRFAGKEASRWEGLQFEAGQTGAPLLPGMLAQFECRTEVIHDGGDHRIFVGRVLRLTMPREGEPLVYYQGDYRFLTRD